MKNIFLKLLEKIEKLFIGITGPIGGLIAGIIGAVYAYTLFDLSVLIAILIIVISGVLGLIWPSRGMLFFIPFLLFIGDAFDGGDSWRSCLFVIFMVLYVLASVGMIFIVFFDPTLLIWTAIIHGLYTLCVVIIEPVNDEQKV